MRGVQGRVATRARAGGARELVLNAELVAVDRANGNRLRSFQELSTRARSDITAQQVPPCMSVCTARGGPTHNRSALARWPDAPPGKSSLIVHRAAVRAL